MIYDNRHTFFSKVLIIKMICFFFSLLKDAYGFSSKQSAMYFNSVTEGMKVFGLDNHEVHVHLSFM